MKTINTLVRDVYALLESGIAKIDVSKLSTMLAGRLDTTKGGPALRMSNAGEKCHRKLWYRQNRPNTSEPIPGFTSLKFLTGDIKEELVLSLVEQTDHKVEGRQEEVEFEGVKGHIDAIIDGMVIDVKSANSRSMEKFKRHALERDDPFGYLDQISLYAEALRDDPRVTVKDEVAFLVADKELGHLVLDRYKLRERPWKDILSNIKETLAKPEPPPRFYQDEPDGKSGNKTICMECRYCSFKEECWKDSNGGRGLRKFLYAAGPKWLTRVMKQPEVFEDVHSKTNSPLEQETKSSAKEIAT